MKYVVLVLCMLFVAGCGLEQISMTNPLGLDDPNQGEAIVIAAQSGAQTVQAVGAATSNPALIGGSALAGAIITILGASYLKKEKK